ncbi:MAG: histidine phosphatase family protein [Streptosporangiales bacterium]|nr:histidine phosphatase family protein [Streptosporangiales bacterium]
MTAESTRRLVVFRHAKSARPTDIDDHDRPLAPRGERDASAAGRWLDAAGWTPDTVLCSTAVRARHTWRGAADVLSATPPVTYERRLYLADVPTLVDLVRATPDDVGTLVLVGHNPGLEDLVVTLAGGAVGDAGERVEAKFPTSAIAVLTVPGAWSALGPRVATLVEVAVPRG